MQTMEHEGVIPELAEHLRPVFERSADGVYVWLDETHWTCNERFAAMFGTTVEEFENNPYFLQRMVHEEDQGAFSWNDWNRVQELAFPVTFRFRATRPEGTAFLAETT